MQVERKVAVVIQARMNSQRVKEKMIRKFGDYSLFEIALRKLVGSMNIPTRDVFIAVGEEPLIDIAKKYPFNIYERSKESCDSTNSTEPDSLRLLYEWYQYLQDKGYTHVVLVSSCNPLLSIGTIDAFYRKFVDEDLDGLFSVTEKHNFYWGKDGKTITDWKGMKLMNTRKIDVVYEGAHCLYGSKISFIEDECWMGDTSPPTPELFVVHDIEAVDIDTEMDFKVAEILYKQLFIE